MNPLSIDAQITFLHTQDLEKTAQFYEEVMRLPLVLDQGGCRIYRSTADAYLGFCERAPTTPNSGVIFTIVTDEVDGWYDHLRAADVPIEKAPATNETYGIYHCFARDPNGYLIEIQRFLDPNWRESASNA
jgi:catechol 2,3-dioxygenase-like lactoylglutathione lyase family enzyme